MIGGGVARLVASVVLALAPLAAQAQSTPVTLDFLPPQMEPRDICGVIGPVSDQRTELPGTQATLTDPDRIRFLRRDINAYMNEDARGYFDFIDALIGKRATLDESFSDVDAEFARIDLWLRAGRLDALTQAGLIAALRDRVDALSNNQRVTLARFYADGVGVAVDVPFAQELIREAAYGGNANALLEIASLAQKGTLVEGWDAPIDLTVTMAFGGILGALDGGVCRRAERIAQAYLAGDVVTANPALALAWFKFAADMGRGQSAWRVVEHYLNAPTDTQDNIEMERYLRQAVRRGVKVSAQQGDRIAQSGAISKQKLEDILGFNHAQDDGRTPHRLADLVQLDVNIPEVDPDGSSLYLEYLREIAEMPQAPGRIFDRLGQELMVSQGRWAAEAEAMTFFEQAARRGDGRGTRRLAKMLLRYRDDPAQVARAETLLMEAVARHGLPEALNDLDTLYRCQALDAPRLAQADQWARQYAASGHETVRTSALDLLALSPSRAPEALARIQSLAVQGRPSMVAAHAQRVQANPLSAQAALGYWASRIQGSEQALEIFAELQFELAQTPVQRDQGIEFFRRVYLNNGVTSALDLAIALTEYNARDPKIAKEIVTLLTLAGNRGEGGAIRLLSRLTTGAHSSPEVYAQFADTIEARGDFLAMMFAIPHVDAAKADDYFDRAVSLMSCGTKDADELGDAYAIRQMPEQSFHWRQIGLHFEGGHVLSKLRLSDRQMALYGTGAAPDAAQRAAQAFEDGDPTALMRLLGLTANAGLETYDPKAAVDYFLEAVQRTPAAGLAEIAGLYRAAPQDVRDGIDQRTDIIAALQGAAGAGDVASAYALGLVLRDRAATQPDLATAAQWFEQAASRGHTDAMYELGMMLGNGLGRPVDMTGAVNWLQQAAGVGHKEAAKMVRLFKIKGGL